jgi:endonuclease YncB( thermonuclease family)
VPVIRGLRLGLLIVATAVGAGVYDHFNADPAACGPGVVTHVRDADTIEVGDCAVRLLAVDAPETQRRQRGTPWCGDYELGKAAKQAVVELVLGEPVTFGASEGDSSGRDMAAEVILADGTELGHWLLVSGYAVVWPAESPAEACPAGHGPGMEPNR